MAKIGNYSELFRKVAHIMAMYHICRPFYRDINYLCVFFPQRDKQLIMIKKEWYMLFI